MRKMVRCSCFGASDGDLERSSAGDPHGMQDQMVGDINQFPYKRLIRATNNFHPSNKIGSGGFGTVYKGVLQDGTAVAMKMLSAESKQGVHEFLTEIHTISNVNHPNLVKLIGCCVDEANRILIYEYVENSSLDRALLGRKSKTVHLDWGKRSVICMGIARGLKFLHEEIVPPIVHRDIKASNILLDKDFDPKIGDFGLAKIFPDSITHINTRIAGTSGYLAPEYAFGGQLTKKADVYSYGVLVLEVISGKSSARTTWGGMDTLLVEWAWKLYEEGRLLELVDPELGEFPEEEITRFIKIAFFCIQAAASKRPHMSQVVEMLSRNIRLNETILTAPGSFRETNSTSSKKSAADTTGSPMNSASVTVTRMTPR